MLTTVLQSPADQIAEARWWVAELSNDTSPGCTPRLLRRARFWLFDLQARHTRGELTAREILVDESVPF